MKGQRTSFNKKKKLLYFFNQLHQKGLITGRTGNASFRENNRIYITPTGKYKGNLKMDDLFLLNIKEENMSKESSSESITHLALYRADPEIRAVFHAHPPWTIALTDLIFNPEVTLSEMEGILNIIEIIPPIPAGSRELADTLFEKAQAGKRFFIVKNHGVFSSSKDIEKAFTLIEAIENFYKVQKIAQQNGYRVFDIQEMLRESYANKDRERGIDGTFRWLVEEIGELARGIKNRDRKKIEEELADCFAWLCSLSNILNVSIEDAMNKKYPGICPKCKKIPCECKEP